jgi:hypothetical protein
MNQTAAVGSLQVGEAPSQVVEAAFPQAGEAAVTLVAVTASKDLDNFLTKS